MRAPVRRRSSEDDLSPLDDKEVAMRRLIGTFAAVAMVALATLSACKSSSDQSQTPGETKPGMAQPPAPQGNVPAAPAQQGSSDTGSRGY
jgi:hypothetical protein